nr:hypothetical protein [Tanacetum cinerariifolium]
MLDSSNIYLNNNGQDFLLGRKYEGLANMKPSVLIPCFLLQYIHFQDEEDEEECGYETDSKDEQAGSIATLKPVFVKKSKRDTTPEREKIKAEERPIEEFIKMRVEEIKVEKNKTGIKVRAGFIGLGGVCHVAFKMAMSFTVVLKIKVEKNKPVFSTSSGQETTSV